MGNSYYWTGVPGYDYWFYVCNWHPLLGIFFCHPNHPWSKSLRLLMFFASLAITMVPAAYIGRLFAQHEYAAMRTAMTQLSIAHTRVSNYHKCCTKCVYGCTRVFFIWAIL